jgi:hypothetical protein
MIMSDGFATIEDYLIKTNAPKEIIHTFKNMQDTLHTLISVMDESLIEATNYKNIARMKAPSYTFGGMAYCKYCHTTHDKWEWSQHHQIDFFLQGDIVWMCLNCFHSTHDDFMNIDENPQEL